MAGDWIKMRTGLQRSPSIVRISSALNADRFRTIGGLHAVWSLADEQTEDGVLPGYTFATVNEMIGWPGFCEALSLVDWARQTAEGVTFPDFEKHNGSSAKRRAQEADRKRELRSGTSEPVPILSASTSANVSAFDADKKRTREEKRREEIKTPASKKPVLVPLPENWSPSEKTVARLAEQFKFVNGDAERYVMAFRDACSAKGYKYADFDAAFSNCVRQDWPKFRNGAPTMPAHSLQQHKGASW